MKFMRYKVGDVVDYVIESKVICTCVVIQVRDSVFDGYYRVENGDGDTFIIYSYQMRLNKSHTRKDRIDSLL